MSVSPIPPRNEYPRPQLVRASWTCLNGTWEFARERRPGQPGQAQQPGQPQWDSPDTVAWHETITVPFAPETEASGVGDTSFYPVCWYRRTFAAPALARGQQRLMLHFGAVDYAATVWVNGILVAQHEGGYTPFGADITDALRREGEQIVVVRAADDPTDLAKPRGKQDWQREPHRIWYPRTTGIWQSVWLETVNATHIRQLVWTANLERYEIGLDAIVEGPWRDGAQLQVILQIGERVLANDTYTVIAGEVARRIALSDPGIDDYRNEVLWSPERPTLITARLTLRNTSGVVLDAVESYTALRSVMAQGDRFLLNGRPLNLRLVLDQGYWPDTGLTPPSDDALRRDVELVKAMGFNGVRKHQKIEDPRFLYWADRLGLLVWEEMPSAYRFTKLSVQRLVREWQEAIERDRSHPCIVAWVPFNESWGVPDLPNIAAQREYVRAIYHLTKTLDGDRPVIGNDGWESVATDIIGIHDYDGDTERIGRRYAASESIPNLFKRERPAGRVLALDPLGETPIMLTEFGGISLAPRGTAGAWGYSDAGGSEALRNQYTELLETVRSLALFAGFCYTQFTDTYQETNGLLTMEREPKFPIEEIARATRGW